VAVVPPLARARRKAYARLIPLLFVCYVVNYIDRSNIAIAKLFMERELGFDNAVFGTAAGMFFIGYFLLEVPGALLVETWSARRWIARIMVSWGIIAALQAAVRTPAQFHLARFSLGLAEAGFFPGVVVYLTHWFPARDRARAVALFMTGTPVAQMLSPKLSGFLLHFGTPGHPAPLGLAGWQWVYIAWGVPAVILGVVVALRLPDRPRHARWLSAEEREALEAELASEGTASPVGVLRALRHPRVLLICVAYIFAVTAFYGVDFFLPTILTRWYGLDIDRVTWLLLIPAVASFAGLILAAWSSDRTGERRLHTVVPLALAAVALVLTPLSRGSLPATVALFTLATVGIKAYLPGFWCLPGLFLSGAAAAGSTGFINSVGNLGGFLGPKVIGELETRSGSFGGGLYFISAAAAVAATGIFLVGVGRERAARAR
jgi:ACS family tartrate transporter-like MFS transporter